MRVIGRGVSERRVSKQRPWAAFLSLMKSLGVFEVAAPIFGKFGPTMERARKQEHER